MLTLPDFFVQRLTTAFADGAAWLDALPDLLTRLAAQWQLTLGDPVAGLSYNYVAEATLADGTAVILKCGVPNRELFTEMDALAVYDGRGAVRLLAADRANAAMLLERVMPGTELSTMADDAAATRIAARVMRQLWLNVPTTHSFPTLADWAQVFGRVRQMGNTAMPLRLLDKAERLFADLSASAAAPVLLHGDLHHFNMLDGGNGRWLAIDPKGVIGEAAFEPARFLHNPYPHLLHDPQLSATILQRVAIFAEMLGMEKQRLLGWGFIDAMFSTCWCIEEGDDCTDQMMAFLQVLDMLSETRSG